MKLDLKNNKSIKIILFCIIVIAISTVIFVFYSSDSEKVYANNLMDDISSNKVNEIDLNDEFIDGTADFSIKLLTNNLANDENLLISPLSVYLALGMTANGADNDTLEEFKKVLSNGNLEIDELNENYYSLSEKVTKESDSKLNIANSIWYRDDLKDTVNKDFLQKNADYFGADAFISDFTSKDTVDDINNWVSNNTDGLIEKIIEKINDDVYMYLINTVLFDSEWEVIYEENQIRQDTFKLSNLSTEDCEFMFSTENNYLENDNVSGFIKSYKGGKFSFVALLPNEGLSVEEILNDFKGNEFVDLIENAKSQSVEVGIPKFKYSDNLNLNESLKFMGLKKAFGAEADFQNMVSKDSKLDLSIGNVLHKTYIQVDERGTKAGAVTSVEMDITSVPQEMESVILNRPFIYAIIENDTKLPVFIGVLNNPNAEK
jgi:serpin B